MTILAARATSSGHALGADFSRIQIAKARQLAAAAGVANVRFEIADAQVHPFGAGVFDVLLMAAALPAAASPTMSSRAAQYAGDLRSDSRRHQLDPLHDARGLTLR